MPSLNLSAEQIIDEVANFNKKLATGYRNLITMGDTPEGVTDHEIIYREDTLKLLHYKSPTPATNPVPTLIVYALVNRPYMTDLQEDRSTIKGLLASGQDVYLIDWGYPTRADRYLMMEDYINSYIDNCITVICKKHKLKSINLLGICQGGVLSLCYSALHPKRVKNLITMVTPIDFHTADNQLSHWVKHINVDQLIDSMGNVSGETLNQLFRELKPYELMANKYLNAVDLLDKPEALKNFMVMEKWISDSPDQAGETLRQFVKDFFQDNKLIHNQVHIADKKVNLLCIKCPVFNIYALYDHIVPPDASRALNGLTASQDYTELAFKGGHIGIYVSRKATQVTQAIGEWLNQRSV